MPRKAKDVVKETLKAVVETAEQAIDVVSDVTKDTVDIAEDAAKKVSKSAKEAVEKQPAVKKAVKGTKDAVEKAKEETKATVKKTVRKAKAAVRKEPAVVTYIQYQGKEVCEKDLVEAVLAQYAELGNDKADVEEINLYIKPEDHAVYYVINSKVAGKVYM